MSIARAVLKVRGCYDEPNSVREAKIDYSECSNRLCLLAETHPRTSKLTMSNREVKKNCTCGLAFGYVVKGR